VITTQAGITEVEDLEGKKIGIQDVGGFNEVMARLLLATRGMTPKDVQYVDVTTAGRVPGRVSGQIDASVLHIDQCYNATKQKPDLVALAKMWEIAPDWWYSAYVASDQQVKENREALVSFTVDKQVEIGAIKAEQKPSLDKLIDRSLADEAIKRNGGPMTGDPRRY
jgi:ABC-type nitrate/sulfonate/bicarbonate transport system substrate-binding protein